MKRLRSIGIALLAVFALGTVTASAAQAEAAPSFAIEGARLIAGQTHNFDARQLPNATNDFELATPTVGIKILCTGLSTERGVLLGSNVGNPGIANEIAVFSGCSLIEGNGTPSCHLAAVSHGAVTTETLTTNQLKSEEVVNSEGGAAGKKLLEELSPASTSQGFITLNFGGECTTFQSKVFGSTVAEVLLDNASRGSLELGQAPQERRSWIVNFPRTPITEVWLVSGGTGKLVPDIELQAFGVESTLKGTELVLLASTKYVPELNTLWSPLP